MLVSAVCSGCGNWSGFGFHADGPELPRLRQALALKPGMVVADVGAGKGELTLALVREVGPTGHVFSTEIDPARLALLRDAVAVLRAKPGVEVYLDAGHSAWHPVATMVGRLRRADVARATGFALNVSNFQLTANEVAYGRGVSAQLGGKHFVIDTGRNGLGPSGAEWCNPSGRALGPRPTTVTGDSLVDAFLWIKQPGLSDGTCNGGPAAGAWWADYALGLARRSAY